MVKNDWIFDIFDQIQTISDQIWTDFDIINFFDLNWTRFDQFCHDLNSGFKFGSKKLIKRQFEYDLKWI